MKGHATSSAFTYLIFLFFLISPAWVQLTRWRLHRRSSQEEMKSATGIWQ
jgi:hypothetical protein